MRGLYLSIRYFRPAERFAFNNETPLARDASAPLSKASSVAMGIRNVRGHFVEKSSFLNPLLEAAGYGQGVDGLNK